ncbi:MAG: amidohydrolase family protein [Longimicrobiaceae bacterium]
MAASSLILQERSRLILQEHSRAQGRSPGFGDLRNYELLVQAGFTPEQAIQIMTLNGARILHEEARIGSIAPGKAADLVVIRGDPIATPSRIYEVTTVFRDGVGYDSARRRGGRWACSDTSPRWRAVILVARHPLCGCRRFRGVVMRDSPRRSRWIRLQLPLPCVLQTGLHEVVQPKNPSDVLKPYDFTPCLHANKATATHAAAATSIVAPQINNNAAAMSITTIITAGATTTTAAAAPCVTVMRSERSGSNNRPIAIPVAAAPLCVTVNVMCSERFGSNNRPAITDTFVSGMACSVRVISNGPSGGC